MQFMSDYKIVQDKDKQDLTVLINTYLSEGYVVVGGVAVNYISTQFGVEPIFTQAIVKP